MNPLENKKPETFYLGWLDPRNKKIREAGVAFYVEEYGEYLLKIDEDYGKQFYLKPITKIEARTNYRLEMIIKRKDGSFLKRQCVGDGFSSKDTDGHVHIWYGSKFATLVLFLKTEENQ